MIDVDGNCKRCGHMYDDHANEAACLRSLAERLDILRLAVSHRDDLLAEQQKRIDRLLHPPTIEVQLVNSEMHFRSYCYRAFGDILGQTVQHFKLDAQQLENPRFYWVPTGPNSTSASAAADMQRLCSTADWEAFLDQWEQQESNRGVTIVLRFFCGGLGPATALDEPSTPPMQLIDEADRHSEPDANEDLSARDGDKCVVCGIDVALVAHVVDQSRMELLADVPNAPGDINDLGNLIHLCPNHHVTFDRFEWTMVKEKRTTQDGTVIEGFAVRPTPVLPKPSDDVHFLVMHAFVRFASDIAPSADLFLLKQLGRFDVPCRVCGVYFPPKSLVGHYAKDHGDASRQKWEGFSGHLLPKPCDCADRGSSPWELFCHLKEHHRHLLYV